MLRPDGPSGGRTARLSSDAGVDAALWIGASAVGLLTVVYTLGAIPPGLETFSGADKLGHGLACFASVLLLLLAAVWRPGRGAGPFPAAAPFVVGTVVASGILLEVLQATFTARSAEVLDVVMETAGALAALGVVEALRRRV